ncbi:MAG: hypothetical protein GXO98_01045 [Nitrospirae bacterium]|nr:hypothetical protein [Nitrospirota bacterium]
MMSLPPRFFQHLLLLLFLSTYLSPAISAEDYKTFETKYTTIHYSNDKDIDKFIWRIGGKRLNLESDTTLAKYRIDRIMERVQTILDMHPEDMHIDIFLSNMYKKINKVAFYSYKKNAIYIVVDNANDGVLAHEMAHAVISSYFGTPPPAKMQEILAQYVDKQLWSDY